jgi:glycosyltransferase involved in cell wall biosynthesis
MRIGVDATCWGNRRGYGRFARSLLGAVLEADRASEYVFFTDETSDEFPLPSSVEVVRVAAGTPTIRAAAANGARSLGDMWAVSRAISRRALDLFFFPSVYSYVPLTSGVAQLVTIHDVIPEKFPELVFPNGWSRLFWNAKVRVACAQARLILTVSEYSRECLREVLGLEPGRLRVVNEAGDPAFRRVAGADAGPLWKRLGVAAGTRYIVYVGGFSPHKNLGLLVEVLRELHADAALRDVHLVLAGDYQGDVFFSCYRQLAEQVQRAGLQQRVVFTGYMNDGDLLLLLNQAQALALPSFCEGFGLPAVEAAACGAPVVATTASPLPGLLGEGAICLAPEDRAGWREALRTVLSDGARRERMRGAALAAAARLSWEHSARQLLEVFAEVASPAGKQGVA